MRVRGQLSAEMLIVLVVILGLAVILASVMLKSANKAASAVEEKTNSVIAASNASSVKVASGGYCTADSDCESNSCGAYSNKCD